MASKPAKAAPRKSKASSKSSGSSKASGSSKPGSAKARPSAAKASKGVASKAAPPKAAAAAKTRPAGRVTVAKAEGADAVKGYIAKLPGWQATAVRKLDTIVSKEVPDAVRAVKWSAAFYGVPGGGWFVSAKGFSKVVKFTFFRGTSLRPVPPSGEHEQGRALDVKDGEAIDEAQLAAWVRQAASMPGWGNV